MNPPQATAPTAAPYLTPFVAANASSSTPTTNIFSALPCRTAFGAVRALITTRTAPTPTPSATTRHAATCLIPTSTEAGTVPTMIELTTTTIGTATMVVRMTTWTGSPSIARKHVEVFA